MRDDKRATSAPKIVMAGTTANARKSAGRSTPKAKKSNTLEQIVKSCQNQREIPIFSKMKIVYRIYTKGGYQKFSKIPLETNFKNSHSEINR